MCENAATEESRRNLDSADLAPERTQNTRVRATSTRSITVAAR